MKFETISDLIKHIEEFGDITKLNFTIDEMEEPVEDIKDDETNEPCPTCAISDADKDEIVKVESVRMNFSDIEDVKFKLDSGAQYNTLIVEDYKKMDIDGCFTGNVRLYNTDVLCNICENENGSKVTFPMIINDQNKFVTFILQKGDNTEVILNPRLI